MPQQVFLFLDSRSIGGIESHIRILAALLSKHCQVTVVLWQQYLCKHPLVQQLAAHDVKTVVIGGRVAQFVALLKNTPDAVLHCHGYKANLIGRLIAVLFSVRCVCTFHNGDRGSGRVRFYTWLDEITSIFSRNIAVSKEIANRIKGPSVVMANSVELPSNVELTGYRTGPVAFVGRLEQVKRPDRFCKLAKEFPSQQFALWGDGSLRNQLEKQSMPNLTWHGAVDNMSQYWLGIDLLIICSEQEGFPMVALEAMAAGVPVLALPLGDLPTLINHGVNGFIADNEIQMQHYLTEWFSLNSAERGKIRENARMSIAKHYDAECVWPKLANLYGKR